ncbi:MAG: hypothetical protein AABZ53_11485 [Planctomycetota bacterium]
MELERIRQSLHEHPSGIAIQMVNGTEYHVPHHDRITFGPLREKSDGERVAVGSTFLVFETDDFESMKLVNALLVSEVVPLKLNGNGHGKGKKSKKKG